MYTQQTSELKNLETQGLFLLSSANAELYIEQRIKNSSGRWRGNIKDGAEAQHYVRKFLTAESQRALSEAPHIKPISDPQIIAKVIEAFKIYTEQRTAAGVTLPVSIGVCHDMQLRPGMNRTTGLGRVIVLNSDPAHIDVPVIAHEMGHTGSKTTYGVTQEGIALLKTSLVRPHNGFYALQLFEEVASMAYMLAAYEPKLVRTTGTAQCLADRPLSPCIEGVMGIVFQVVDPAGARAAQGAHGVAWVGRYMQQKKDAGFTRFGFKLPIYQGPGFDSQYACASCAADMLGEEIFAELPAAEAQQAFRRICIRAQALSDPTPLLAVLERKFSSEYLPFFTCLESYDAPADRAFASSVMLGLFAQTARQLDERSIRSQLLQVAKTHFVQNSYLLKEYQDALSRPGESSPMPPSYRYPS